MPPSDLPSYVRWVIDQKPELRDTPEDIKAELQVQLEDRLESLVNAALLAELPESEVTHFEKVLLHSTDEQVQQYIANTIPNSEEIVARVLLQFRNEYLGA